MYLDCYWVAFLKGKLASEWHGYPWGCFTWRTLELPKPSPLKGLEDHPRTDRYVVNNHGDPFRPLSIQLWDPFQMAELHGLFMEVILPLKILLQVPVVSGIK